MAFTESTLVTSINAAAPKLGDTTQNLPKTEFTAAVTALRGYLTTHHATDPAIQRTLPKLSAYLSGTLADTDFFSLCVSLTFFPQIPNPTSEQKIIMPPVI